jgi:hypothetical protein
MAPHLPSDRHRTYSRLVRAASPRPRARGVGQRRTERARATFEHRCRRLCWRDEGAVTQVGSPRFGFLRDADRFALFVRANRSMTGVGRSVREDLMCTALAASAPSGTRDHHPCLNAVIEQIDCVVPRFTGDAKVICLQSRVCEGDRIQHCMRSRWGSLPHAWLHSRSSHASACPRALQTTRARRVGVIDR